MPFTEYGRIPEPFAGDGRLGGRLYSEMRSAKFTATEAGVPGTGWIIKPSGEIQFSDVTLSEITLEGEYTRWIVDKFGGIRWTFYELGGPGTEYDPTGTGFVGPFIEGREDGIGAAFLTLAGPRTIDHSREALIQLVYDEINTIGYGTHKTGMYLQTYDADGFIKLGGSTGGNPGDSIEINGKIVESKQLTGDVYTVWESNSGDRLYLERHGAGDFIFRNDQQDNGVIIYDGTGGVGFQYNGTEGLRFDGGDPPQFTVQDNTSDYLRIRTAHGYADIGARNSGGYHIYTDRPVFYFNTSLAMVGGSLGTDPYPATDLYLENAGWVRWGDGGENIVGSNTSSYIGLRAGGSWRLVIYTGRVDAREDLLLNGSGVGIQFTHLPPYNNSWGSMRWRGTNADMGQAHTSSSLAVKRNVKPVRTRGKRRTQRDGTYSETGSVFDRLTPIHFEYAPDHPFRDRWKGRRVRPDKRAEFDELVRRNQADPEVVVPRKHDDEWYEDFDAFEEYEAGGGIGRMGFAYEQVKRVAPHFTYEADGMEAIGYEGMLPDFMAWAVATIRDLRDRVETLEEQLARLENHGLSN